MADIVGFIEARLTEDEGAAKAATQGAWEVLELDGELSIRADQSAAHRSRTEFRHVSEDIYDRADADHIARWDPARVLAEIMAKRGRVAEFRTWDAKLKQVGERPDTFSDGNRGEIQGMWMMARRAVLWDATVYADHPDYDPAWRIYG